MTELPTTKMGFATCSGRSRDEARCGSAHLDLRPRRQPSPGLSPSRSTNIDHGFASIANFFPGTKVAAQPS